ncbi:MAG: prepilin-type N-terminal cleavage/methylation domain-containing protein [Acidobacteriota bacterium]|nr:prepilin-type N-terminal cleavage/methylation domain-containing protein [Acidobacteriota bacterium]
MKDEKKPAASPREGGFSLIEMMGSTAILLVLLAVAYGFLNSMVDVNKTSRRATEITQNLQSGLTMLRRDTQQAWRGFKGLENPLAPADGPRLRIPAGTTYRTGSSYPAADRDFFYGVEPGTNSLTIMFEAKEGKVYSASRIENNDGDGTRLVWDSAADFNDVPISVGDFVLLYRGAEAAQTGIVQAVTGINATTRQVRFSKADSITHVNQNWGDLKYAGGAPLFGAASPYTDVRFRIYRRITYALDTTGNTPWLTRQTNTGIPVEAVPGVSRFALSYRQRLSDNDGTLIPFTDFNTPSRFQLIRSVDVEMVCLSDEAITNGDCVNNGGNYTGAACAPNGISTEMAIRKYGGSQFGL